jgi:hypothetical protein
VTLALRADPDRGVLIGWVILLAFLFPPTLLLLLIVEAWLEYNARMRRDHLCGQRDTEFADRFHQLEQSILEQPEPEQTPSSVSNRGKPS